MACLCFIFEKTKSRNILSCVSQFTLHCIDRVLCLSHVPPFFLYYTAVLLVSVLCLHVYFLWLLCFSPSYQFFQESKSKCILLWFSTETQYVSGFPVRPCFWRLRAWYANAYTHLHHTLCAPPVKNPVVPVSFLAMMSCYQLSDTVEMLNGTDAVQDVLVLF